MTAKTLEILLVEDNIPDVRLTSVALSGATVPNRLHVAPDGVEAMAFLRRVPPHTRAPRPDLILLDLNLPRKDGREVLDEIKNDETLKHIPVVILTTSQAEADILKSYRLRANAYVSKPVDFDQFVRAIHAIEEFWLKVAHLARFAP